MLTRWSVIVVFRTARKPVCMSRIIGWDLLGQLTHPYPSDYCHQTFEITSNRITASSILENSTSFMSVGFEGSNFVASSHSNFFYGCLPYIVTSINAPVYSLFLSALAHARSEGTVGISGGPLPRWMVDARISMFRAALIKYGTEYLQRAPCQLIGFACNTYSAFALCVAENPILQYFTSLWSFTVE